MSSTDKKDGRALRAAYKEGDRQSWAPRGDSDGTRKKGGKAAGQTSSLQQVKSGEQAEFQMFLTLFSGGSCVHIMWSFGLVSEHPFF